MGEWYLQDTRSMVGNSMLWWAKGGHSYTCEIRKAEVFTRAAAFNKHAQSSHFRPWPKAYIDERISHHIDVQHCEYAEAYARKDGAP